MTGSILGMEERPWTTNELKRLSRTIRNSEPSDDVANYLEVMSWYNDLATDIQRSIACIDWQPLLSMRSVEVTSRPKTIDTLRQKLLRYTSIPLPNVQDIAGIRVEADMNLDEQDVVVEAIVEQLFQFNPQVRDLREKPHSGYRAVHIWVYPFGGRAEIQVRTHTQGAWANMYEAAGDRLGRGIRYGELPVDEEDRGFVLGLQKLSTHVATRIEETRRELDKLDASKLQRAGSHRRQTDRSAMVQNQRKLRRQHSQAELEFRQRLDMLRRMFQQPRPNG